MRDRHGLLTQPIGRVLLNMSLPNLIGILTILGFSLVDTFFISQLGTESLAAISFTFPVTLIITSIAIGIGAGVSTNLGRLIGGGHADKAKVFLHDALMLTFLLIAFIALLGSLCIDPLFSLLGANDSSLPLIHDYMFIWYLGAPLLVLLMVGNQGLRATGDTKSPAKIMMLAALINLILDPLLIFGIGPFPRLEIEGAAIATVISWVLALSLSTHLLIFKRHLVDFVEPNIERLKCNWKQLAHIAQPAAMMNLLNPLANAIIMAMLARIDHSAVAAFGAGTRLESVMLIAVMALSSSLVPFVAQNLGAGQTLRARNALLLSLKFVLVFQTLIYLPLLFLAQPLAQLFSSDPQVVEWLSFYILVMPAAYGPLGIVILVATSLNAYHRPMSSLILNVCRLFLIMLPLAALGSYLGGVKGLLLALPITNAIMGIACYVLATRISEPEKTDITVSQA
ncbi:MULTISPECIES: MATE family efflux transporter [unclassified Shewanella]|uniref:MATE family efflux transporter n=1 Tax=unclassified Shewanella TaxID=196818 RepID=UPI001BC2BBE4|nr:MULTISPECIES: MATE family efflux transporter [unclassified Shewanella]GIU13562.1 MATE family efflux transporter [Shewanella sp. MBTL60-112-B1]GIU28051.1 MATE family efflux transporter [Shewanella sp. MBTL60-112-B2]